MNRIKFSRRVVVLATVALSIAFVQLGNSRLESPSASSRERTFTAAQVFGLVPGQRARFCVGTLSPSGADLDWSIQISDEQGVLLLQLPETHSPAGEWRCIDAPRSSIPVAGEPTTGRVQVAARHMVNAPAGTQPAQIIGSTEILDSDGRTETTFQIFFSPPDN